MKTTRMPNLLVVAFIAVLPVAKCARGQESPLPLWNDSPAKLALTEFVSRVTREGGPDFVPPAERIAVFDNDGTLWCEHPMYVQMAFALDRVKAMAAQHPEWKEQEPFAAVLRNDLKGMSAAGEKGLMELMAATHSGMTTEEFTKIVSEWLATAKHPKYQRPYTECVYRPMVELLNFLQNRGFKTFIVSGGGVEFMRPWAEKVYGIPPERVIGSSGKLKYELRGDTPVLVKVPELDFFDDKAGKPVAIQQHIGRRPIAAFGNSDGDYEMLRWTTSGPGARLGMIIHHTDADREFAYDRHSHFGQLDKALTEAPMRGWAVVDMKREWNKIFAFEK